MRKPFILLFFFAIFCFTTIAQTNGSSSSSANSSSVVELKKEPPKKGVEIPPEKKLPISVPKITTPLSIDGKVDEEVWKTAAVFKDFYQTAPGDNVAPSRRTEAYLARNRGDSAILPARPFDVLVGVSFVGVAAIGLSRGQCAVACRGRGVVVAGVGTVGGAGSVARGSDFCGASD